MWNGVRAEAGAYVSLGVTLTCVRCASGAQDGRVQRQSLKNAMFAQMYGRTSPGPGPILQNYVADDTVFTLTLARLRRRSILRQCTRVATVLYSKATETTRA